ncbi:MAG: hypothetical protein R2844_18205 [Caldilineales bacterium]
MREHIGHQPADPVVVVQALVQVLFVAVTHPEEPAGTEQNFLDGHLPGTGIAENGQIAARTSNSIAGRSLPRMTPATAAAPARSTLAWLRGVIADRSAVSASA